MTATNQIIVELQATLDRARDDVRDAELQRPAPPGAEMLRLRTAAHTAWRALEEAKKL